MARSSKSFQNFKSHSDYDWAAMTTESKESKLRLLRDYEEEAAVRRQGPYGVLWEQQKITRRPTPKEVSDLVDRLTGEEYLPTEK